MKKVIVVGGGGHAKVLIDSLLHSSTEIIGYTDLQSTKTQPILGAPFLGNDDEICRFSDEEILLVNGIGSIENTTNRRTLFEKWKRKGYMFATVIHPSAVISTDVQIGEGAQIMAGSVIQAGATIGSNSIINTKSSIDHDCVIESHVHIAPGGTISGNVYVGEGAHIGTGAVVIQGIHIGKKSLVGAGTLVLKDVPEGAKVVGIPARILKRIQE